MCAAARLAHFLARALEIVGEEEIRRAVADHLLRRVAEHGTRARADANEIAARVDHQDEIERGVEDALVDRADRLAFALALQDRAAALVLLAAEQDGVAARMRIAAHVDPGAEHLGEPGERDRLAAQLRRRVDGAKRIVRADVEHLVDRLADQRADVGAPQALDGFVDVEQPPIIIERDDAVGDAGQNGVAGGGHEQRVTHERARRALHALIVHRLLRFGERYRPLWPRRERRITLISGRVKRFPGATGPIAGSAGSHAHRFRKPVSATPAAPAAR